jgi:hypothetical protein
VFQGRRHVLLGDGDCGEPTSRPDDDEHPGVADDQQRGEPGDDRGAPV